MRKNKKHLIGLGLLIIASIIISGQVEAANDFGTISIANPDNPSEGFTIMDRNLGATSNDINNKSSYGYKYQWGNNYGFENGCYSNKCRDSVTDTSKGVGDGEQYEYRNGFTRKDEFNNKGYYETIFFRVNISPRYHWGEGNYHDGLWGGSEDDDNNNWGENSENFQDRQGPCPKGYHVPSAGERGLLIEYWRNTYGKDITNYGENYFYSSSDGFRNYFKLPYAGYRGSSDALLYQQGYEGRYRSSSPYGTKEDYEYRDSQEGLSSDISEYARLFRIDINYVGADGRDNRHSGYPIRCFKNIYEPEVTTNSEIVIDEPGVTTNSEIIIDCEDPIIKSTCSDLDSDSYKDCPEICKSNAILINNITKTVEINPNQNNRKTIFDGTYTALNDNVKFNYYFVDTSYDPDKDNNFIKKRCEKNKTEMTFYLYIDGKLAKTTHMFDTCNLGQGAGFGSWIDEINLNKGQTKKIKIEIEVEGSVQEDDTYNFRLYLDKHNKDSQDSFNGGRSTDFAPIKIVHSAKENNDDTKITYDTGSTANNTNNGYSKEMNDAYEYAYNNGITTINSIEKAKINSSLTRIAMAKMLSYYAINVLGQKPDTSKGTPIFNDVTDNLNKQYNDAVTLSYQLGIMGQNMKNNNFRPNDEVTRAEFATALSRMLYGIPDGSPYYTSHLKKLMQEGIISNDNPTMKEKRGYVMLMLMRSVK